MFQPEVAPFGLRMTRAALIDLSDDDYEPSPTGRHLALYAEPRGGGFTTADYVANIVPVTRALAAMVFDRWPGLESFDLCQEPPAGVNDLPAPIPETQVNVTREAARTTDWSGADLTDLLEVEGKALVESRPPGIRVSGSDAVEADPAFRAALRTAEARIGEEVPLWD